MKRPGYPALKMICLVAVCAWGTRQLSAEQLIETTTVAMRDGVKLATDLYRNSEWDPVPAVLVRTPYNKSGVQEVAEKFVAAGYALVVQDCRGRFASEGDFVPYNSEGQDGYDAIEWLQRQKWCDGRIAMWGASYFGATQWQAAVEKPPGLVALMPTATWSSFYRNLYLGGAVRVSLIASWAGHMTQRPAGVDMPSDWDQVLLHLPLSDVDDRMGWSIPWLEAMLTHPRLDGYWQRLELADQITDLALPIQHIVGYYDFFARESVGNFMLMQQQARHARTRGQQQLILGPWDHGTIGRAQVGEVHFGENAVFDRDAANIAWLDRYLKPAAPAGQEPLVPVRYFSMGDNQWQQAQTWPPAGFHDTEFYLHSHGSANTRQGDGRLDSRPPSRDEPPDQFVADPAQPIPACPVSEARALHQATWAPVDQRPIEDRQEVLVYSTGVLHEPLEFAGNITARLYVAADTVDADWVVKLVDVHPDGFSQNLAVGILRGRFRNSARVPEPLIPGQVYQINVDLGPVAAQIGQGHRLRVDLCGSYFPLFDRNTNTGEGPFSSNTQIATQQVYHQAARASCLVLPLKQ